MIIAKVTGAWLDLTPISSHPIVILDGHPQPRPVVIDHLHLCPFDSTLVAIDRCASQADLGSSVLPDITPLFIATRKIVARPNDLTIGAARPLTVVKCKGMYRCLAECSSPSGRATIHRDVAVVAINEASLYQRGGEEECDGGDDGLHGGG